MKTLIKAVREYGAVVGFCECGCGREMCKQDVETIQKITNGKAYFKEIVIHRKFWGDHGGKND